MGSDEKMAMGIAVSQMAQYMPMDLFWRLWPCTSRPPAQGKGWRDKAYFTVNYKYWGQAKRDIVLKLWG